MLTFTQGRPDGESVRFSISGRDAAHLIRRERRLCTGAMLNDWDHRCLFGALEGWHRIDGRGVAAQVLTPESRHALWLVYLAGVRFSGSEEERCRLLASMVARL